MKTSITKFLEYLKIIKSEKTEEEERVDSKVFLYDKKKKHYNS